MPHLNPLTPYVFDADTSERLPGEPSSLLVLSCGHGAAALAEYVADHDAWTFLDADVNATWPDEQRVVARKVRCAVPADVIANALEWLCGLLRAADVERENRNELMYDRQVESFYGSSRHQALNEELSEIWRERDTCPHYDTHKELDA